MLKSGSLVSRLSSLSEYNAAHRAREIRTFPPQAMATPMRLEVETGVIVRLRRRVTTWGGGWGWGWPLVWSGEEKGKGRKVGKATNGTKLRWIESSRHRVAPHPTGTEPLGVTSTSLLVQLRRPLQLNAGMSPLRCVHHSA